ncbi:MAG: hypothetical protein JXR73_18000 [Candidatus Omnitrophica bacterium]|nr:hypothetical protein [Candidatus Omnitrophota bacterium]
MDLFRRSVAMLIVSTLLLFLSTSSRSDRVKPMNLEELVKGAEIIFEGECAAVRSGKDPETDLIATWSTFRIMRGIKGELGEEYILKQYGGVDGETRVKAPGARYQVGEQVILFLYGVSRMGFSSAVGLTQGKFTIKETAKSKVRYATNGMPSMILFDKMDSDPPAITTQGVKAKGQELLRSEKLELKPFLAEIERLVEKEKNSQKRAEK